MVRGGLGREGKGGERGRRQAGLSTSNTVTVKVESAEREKECQEKRRNGAGTERFLRQGGQQEEER